LREVGNAGEILVSFCLTASLAAFSLGCSSQVCHIIHRL
jgi:hypothetical protein